MTRRQTLALYALGAAVLLAGCTPRVKPQPPTPPKPVETGRPSAPVYTDHVLRTEGGRLVMNGRPFRMVGAIPCWPSSDEPGALKVDGVSVDYDWPLVGRTWLDAVAKKGVNAFHVRLGPSLAKDQCCGIQSLGGPYLETGGWNPTYFAGLHARLRHGGDLGFVGELNGLDTWVLKYAKNRDIGMPWPDADIQSSMSVPLNASVGAWIDKYVYETCNYGNLVYLIGNESTGVPGWTPEWERANYARIRAAEQQPGCGGVVHMIGSNSEDYDGPYDYFVGHNTGGGASPIAGRPFWENEWNPYRPSILFKKVCDEALAQGTACWYWNSDASDAERDASLNSILAQQAVSACPDPKPDRSTLSFSINCDALYGGSCDATPIVTRSCEYCASIGMGHMGNDPAPRCSCPMRNEGDPNRLVCEQYAMQAPAPVWTSDGAITLVDAYGFRVRTTGTWVRACDATGEHCAQRDVPK